MNKRKRRVIVFTEMELMQFLHGVRFTINSKLPLDTKFISMQHDPIHGYVSVIVESEEFEETISYLESQEDSEYIILDRTIEGRLRFWCDGEELPPNPSEWGLLPALK